MKDKIEFSEFLEIEKKLEITVGLIINAERVPKNNKMLILYVSFGNDEPVTVVTNIGKSITPDELIGKSFNFITNLKPSVIAGTESHAMILIPTKDGVTIFGELSIPGSQIL